MMTRQLMRYSTRGQSLIIMALFLVVLMGIAALAIDLGMLQKARADAQRAADGAALAGASAYLEKTFDKGVAERRVDSIATANDMVGAPIVSGEVTVEYPAANQVRVRVRRAAVPLWFGRIFGINTLPVGAWATAEAAAAGAAKCLKPFALPDMWDESDKANEDENSNRVWDPAEQWEYRDDPADCYRRFGDPEPASCAETGYGSNFRDVNGDLGRLLTLKPRDPNSAITSGWFYPVRLGTNQGANDFADGVVCSCGVRDASGVLPAALCPSPLTKNGDPIVTVLDSVYANFSETGDMVGPTEKGVGDLYCQDEGATWDDPTSTVTNSNWTSWQDSPRLITIGLFDPILIKDLNSGGGLDFPLNNFVTLFLEGFEGCKIQCNAKKAVGNCKGAVRARFVGFAKGFSQGPGDPSSLSKYLRLIK